MIYHVEIFEYENCPHFRSTNDALLVTSVSIALQNVGPTAECPGMMHQY